MDLWQLNVFCKVVEQKSFSKAGNVVHLSQPTVSSHIKDLESHFDCNLIDRLGKEANPTKAGQLLYKYAKKLLALRDEVEIAMSEFHGKLKGRLMIGGSTIPSGFILPPIIGEFSREYPDVTLSLIVGDTDHIANEILAGELELGIVGAKVEHKKIEQVKFVDDEMKLVVPASHSLADKKRINIKQLMELPFIIREKGSGTLKSLKNSLEKKGHSIDDLKVIAEMGSTMAVIQAVKQNIGVSILSTISIKDELQFGTLKALSVDGVNLNRNFFLSWHKLRSLSPLGLAFMAYLDKFKKS